MRAATPTTSSNSKMYGRPWQRLARRCSMAWRTKRISHILSGAARGLVSTRALTTTLIEHMRPLPRASSSWCSTAWARQR
eukprot:169510-Pyramimonas_sp.AAC.1